MERSPEPSVPEGSSRIQAVAARSPLGPFPALSLCVMASPVTIHLKSGVWAPGTEDNLYVSDGRIEKGELA